MKTDRFMQGILISDEDDIFSYQAKKHNHGMDQVVKKLRNIKKNLTSLKYITQPSQNIMNNKQAVFSKTSIDGDLSQAITDVWDRLKNKHESED